jgi:hypothetical protein
MSDWDFDDEELGAIERRRNALALLGDDGGTDGDNDDDFSARRRGMARNEDVIHEVPVQDVTVKRQVVEEMDRAGQDELDRAHNIMQAMPQIDQLEQKAAIAKDRRDALARLAPYRRINPASAMSGGSILGNIQECTSGENPKDVLRWNGEHPADALPVTISVSPVQQILQTASPGGGLQISFRPFARVRWGSAGWLNEADVDLYRGIQLVVNASFVHVQVGMDGATGTDFNGTMKLSGSMGFYGAPRPGQPTYRTVYVDDTNVQTNFQIPAWAKDLTFLRPLDAACRLDFKLATGTVIASVTLAANSTSTYIPTRLPDDAVLVDIVTGGAGITGRLVFGLAL